MRQAGRVTDFRCRQSRGDVIAQPADVSGLKTSSLDAIDFKGPRRSGSSPSSRTHSLPEMAEKREASCDSSGNGEVAEHQNRIASTPERFFCPARGMQAAGIDPLALAHARGSAPKSRICWSSRYVNYLNRHPREIIDLTRGRPFIPFFSAAASESAEHWQHFTNTATSRQWRTK